MLAGFAVVVAAILLSIFGEDDPPSVLDTDEAFVVSVIDGDTIKVSRSGQSTETVRLIGINTPEIDECFGPEAKDELRRLVDGTDVVLFGDVTDVDEYLRLLRYVYLPDGTFVNEALVGRGFALANEFPPNIAWSETLASAQKHARNEGLGLWAKNACGVATSATLVITHVEYDAPGDDNDDLNGEWVDIENRGSTAADLTGWVLKDESATHRFSFESGTVLEVGATIRVFTGCGVDTVYPTSADIYWCEDGAIWNNAGDTAFLLDPKGNIHDEWGY